MINFETFKLNSQEEVKLFQDRLNKYVSQRAQVALPHISLVDAYEVLQSRKDGGRVFSALLDLQINFSLIFYDIHSTGSIWNKKFSKSKPSGTSVLDSEEIFSGKMDIHRYFSSFILRYRALFDKLMGLLILTYSPDEYDKK